MMPCWIVLGNNRGVVQDPEGVNPMVLKAPAKINLFLRVLSRLANGYHEIDSLLVPIGLFDTIRVSFRGDGVQVICPGHEELDGPLNLAHRAASAFFEAVGVRPSATIRIQKRIPIEAGLGGGSSDAGVVLRALQVAYQRPLEQKTLHQIAKQLGADVPFFLGDRPCRARGIGERLTPIAGLPGFWVILAIAPFGVSTRRVYQCLKFPLTRKRDGGSHFHSGGGWTFAQLASLLKNDLQPTGERFHPVLGKVRAQLLDAGAAGAMMSGSGPTVFGIFPTRFSAQGALLGLEKEQGWTYLVARGITTGFRATT